MAPVLNKDGVTFVSLSQTNNQIRIGVEEDRFENQIFDVIRTHNVPEDAINVTVTGAIDLLRSNHTLRDMQRPLAGGLQNIGYDSNGNPLFPGEASCTIGFNILWNPDPFYSRHWVTNSHCTREMFTVDSTDEYYQSSIADGNPGYAGYEVYDPAPFVFPGLCPSSSPCRYSDAAILETTIPGSVPNDIGLIAQTEHSSGPGQGDGSIIIDENNPYFEIVFNAGSDHFFEGMWVSKVGRTTGWTNGPITDPCTTVNFGSYRLLCQVLMDVHAGPGDSGSPVFNRPWPDPNEVTLFGILWGGVGTETAFSRIDGVMEDLGTIITHY